MDCSVSKEFQVAQPQVLSGALKDPSGAVISGLQIELLAGKKVFRKLRTSNQGTFDFEEIPSGRYRIRVRHRGFCAPEVECGTGGCTVKPYLRIEQMSLPVK